MQVAVSSPELAPRLVLHSCAPSSLPDPVTASHHDGGVSFTHARDFVRTIPDARLIETDVVSHFSWLGAERGPLQDAVRLSG